MPRIAIAGFQHETNTFAVTKAGLSEFQIADSWPQMLHGADVLSGTVGINLPIAGFVAAAAGHPSIDLVPLLWCAAEPSAHVTDEAFETISGMILDGIRGAGPVDAIYLDLHGAMVAESHEDGEGELLLRVREVVGDELPVVISLDLHANVTRAMVDHASFIALYRTYPHLDMAATGARCVTSVLAQIAGARPAKAFRQCPYLIPLSAQYTGADPCKSLYALLDDVPPDCAADIALGFTASDIPDTGPSVVAYAPDQVRADAIADRLMGGFLAVENKFDRRLLDPLEAVRTAMASDTGRPVIIADVQDNPGAGGTSDTTGLLTALVEARAQGALLGLMHDPAMAAGAHAAGIGGEIDGALGGKSGLPGQSPFKGRFRVEALSDGNAAFTGEMYSGGVAVLGLSTVLRIEEESADIRVVVTSMRSQCLDLGLFTHFGLDPAEARVIVVKSTVHFRADFEPIAETILNAAAPGVFLCDLAAIPYRRLRSGVRLGRQQDPLSLFSDTP